MTKPGRHLRILLLVIPVCLLLLSFLIYRNHRSFLAFADQLFLQEVSENTLTLHYTLAAPEDFLPSSYDVASRAVTLGDISPAALVEDHKILEANRLKLSSVSSNFLTPQNRLTYEILSESLNQATSMTPFLLYQEPLGATLGIQAQLPVLLAEYAFYDAGDIRDYLALLSQVDDYFDSILAFEQAKSEAGLFMSDTSVNHIIAQCQSFIDGKGDFLLAIFEEKIRALDIFSEDEINRLQTVHENVINAHVLPAYGQLMNGLELLKGTGKNEIGLAGLPGGKSYYEALALAQTGYDGTFSEMEARIREQLIRDYEEMEMLLRLYPDITDATSYTRYTAASSGSAYAPEEILSYLKEQMLSDFPAGPEVSFQVKYVHESMEDYLSPAFYLTPPIDQMDSNTIYINQGSDYSILELFTTLAHEGYPGHLYQTVYFGNVCEDPVRNVLNFGGYVEGWATYVEMCSYEWFAEWAGNDNPSELQILADLCRLNRSLNLGIASYLDIAVHDHGFTREQVAAVLRNVGYESGSAADALYDTLLESPANYLKYYVGYLSFLDLRDEAKEKEGDSFSLQDFHKKILELGPASFRVVREYI